MKYIKSVECRIKAIMKTLLALCIEKITSNGGNSLAADKAQSLDSILQSIYFHLSEGFEIFMFGIIIQSIDAQTMLR